MKRAISTSALWAILALVWGCGGQQGQAEPGADLKQGSATANASDSFAVFGPLEVGADYASYNKVSTEPFLSPTHGKRFVEIYVNDVGIEAYKNGDESPVGTVIVKPSWETDNGTKTDVAGPVFVMEKRAPGFDDEHDNWWYGLHWEKVPAKWQKAMGAEQVYWRSPSKKVDYCLDCHDNYPGQVGLPKKGFRAWETE